MGKSTGKKLDIDKSKDVLKEGGEQKFKICIRCNSQFPAHLKGKVCSCVVGWLAEEQLKFIQRKKDEGEVEVNGDKDVKTSEFLDSHTIPEEVLKYLFREKD